MVIKMDIDKVYDYVKTKIVTKKNMILFSDITISYLKVCAYFFFMLTLFVLKTGTDQQVLTHMLSIFKMFNFFLGLVGITLGLFIFISLGHYVFKFNDYIFKKIDKNKEVEKVLYKIIEKKNK
jgi:hypothetical protein